MMNKIGKQAANQAATAPASGGAAILFQTNPGLAQIIKEDPAVAAFVKNLEANDAIVQPAPGDAKTEVSFGMWTHSKASGGMSKEPFKEIIVVWQPGKASMGLGGYKGQVIGIFRLDQLAFASATEAQQFDKSMKVKQIAPGKFAHVSSDGGWEWKRLVTFAYGKAGQNFQANFAIGPISGGQMKEGGFPGGWGGRTASGRFGSKVATPAP